MIIFKIFAIPWLNLIQIAGLLFASRRSTYDISTPVSSSLCILVISPDSKIGDNIINLYFLFYLRKKYPLSHITVLHHENTSEIYELVDYYDNRISFKFNYDELRSYYKRISLLKKLYDSKNFNRNSYDIAIIPRWDHDMYSPFVSFISGANTRIGFSSVVNLTKRILSFGTDMLLNAKCIYNLPQHEAAKSLSLIEIFTSYDSLSEISLPLRIDSTVASYTLVDERSNTFVVAICIGAGSEKRRWNIDKISTLIRCLVDKYPEINFVFNLIGSKEDYYESKIICDDLELIGIEARNLCGQFSISQLAIILKSVALFIGSDSGLAHLAALIQIPTIVISCHPLFADPNHPNSPVRFKPIGGIVRVVRPLKSLSIFCRNGCTSSKSHCINGVSIKQVFNEIYSLKLF